HDSPNRVLNVSSWRWPLRPLPIQGNALLADGSVKFFTNGITAATWRYLGSAADGVAISNY
ncbi:MAG: H-X9-DG-CTERM domain-containing protein, partial [Planctomycetota bacterium]